MGQILTPANPSVSVGLSAVNGSSPQYMRSDAAPSISQAIAPTMTGQWVFSKNGALSAPSVSFIGTPITGGTTTTCKPQILIETSGAGSTNWSTGGTMLGINAPSGFVGDLVSVQNNGAATGRFKIDQYGSMDIIGASGGSNILTVHPNFNAAFTSASIGQTGTFFFNDVGTFGGNVTLADTINVILNTGTGSKIGTATGQKLGFFNAAPVIQQAGTGTTTGFVANSGTAMNSASTSTGTIGSTAYTFGDVVKALKNLGLMAA